jgi:hypothetical protein
MTIVGEPRDATQTPTVIAGLKDGPRWRSAGSTPARCRWPAARSAAGASTPAVSSVDGSVTSRATPAPVAGLRDVVQRSPVDHPGWRRLHLRPAAQRTVSRWGSTQSGAVAAPPRRGGGCRQQSTWPPARATCRRARADGKVICWGYNRYGQAGAPTAARIPPTVVAGVVGAVAVSAGPEQTCARTGKEVLCWGRNEEVQLGVGPDVLARPTPMPGADARRPGRAGHQPCLRARRRRHREVHGRQRPQRVRLSWAARSNRRSIVSIPGPVRRGVDHARAAAGGRA